MNTVALCLKRIECAIMIQVAKQDVKSLTLKFRNRRKSCTLPNNVTALFLITLQNQQLLLPL